MSRSMKWGLATIVAVFAVNLLATDDAEARHRRFGRHRRGGCCGYVQSNCCGVQAYSSPCGVATNCPGGVCGVNGSTYGHSAGYGAAPGAVNGQGTFDQAPTPANGSAPPQPNGTLGSPSDRPPAPAGASNGAAAAGAGAGASSAPPPPPQQ